MIVNSAALEDEEYFDDAEYEDELVDKSTDYTKLAKSIGEITSRGIKISLVDINKSSFSFKPDVANNQILFGLKGVNKVGAEVIEKIVAGRPYTSFKDFVTRTSLTKTVIISLIKAGAFDNLDTPIAWELGVDVRIMHMVYFLNIAAKPKSKLNLQNLNGLIQKNLLPPDLSWVSELFALNKKLKTQKYMTYYKLDKESYRYIELNLTDDLQVFDGSYYILQKTWDGYYSSSMDKVRNWLKENQDIVLKEFNYLLFKEQWDKYAQSSISAWEMESLCFYYHEHELANVDTSRYGIVDFNSLNPEPEVDYFFKRNGKNIPIYKTFKIIGTVIGKNKTKSTVTLLTTTGVVTVKFTKEYYAMFGRQISEKQPDGTKKIIEKTWFERGVKLMITGFRRDDMFVGKTYKNTIGHQLYKIVDVNEDGSLTLVHERAGVGL